MFWHFFEIVLSPKGPPSILLKSSLVLSGMKCYNRTFDVISELYRVLVKRRRRFKNESPTHTLESALFDNKISATVEVPILFVFSSGVYREVSACLVSMDVHKSLICLDDSLELCHPIIFLFHWVQCTKTAVVDD